MTRIRLERRDGTPVWLSLALPVLAVLVTLILCSGLVALAGAEIMTAYAHLFLTPFSSGFDLVETAVKTAPLVLTGLAVAVAFRARFWNIGAEGQLYAGALAAVAVGGLPGPPALLFPAMLVAAMLAGALLLVVPAILRARLGVDEVVTTLLLNFIALLFVSMMLDGPMKDPAAMGWPQSVSLADELQLSKLVARTRVHTGLLWALALAVALWGVLKYSTFGFAVRAVGANARAAAFAGVPVTRTTLAVAVVSGAIAGLAGAIEVAGRTAYVTLDMSPGYGYSGIVIAMLAGLNPLGVVAAAIFVAGVLVGADSMSRGAAVPTYIADVIVAVSLLSMLVATAFARYRLRWN